MEPRQWSQHLKAGPEKYHWYVNTEKLEEQARDLHERWEKKREDSLELYLPNEPQSFADIVQDSTISFDMTVDTEKLHKLFGVYKQDEYRKRITNLELVFAPDMVEITTIDDPFPQYTQGKVIREWRDQDGEPVHPELYRRLEMTGEEVYGQEKIQAIIDEWNAEAEKSGPKPLSELPWGHHEVCPYRGSHHFPCTCQPPTVFGEDQRWYCDCCEEPRAMIQYGLCEMCEAHQYSDGRQADLEHEAAREDA